MADLTTAIALSLEPWTNAKNRFLDSLPDDADRQIFQEASLENLFYTASAGFQHHEFTSKIAKARKKLKPVLESLDGYSKALDVLSQSSASILCPLWGSLRIVLHLALSYEKYYDKIIDMYDRIGDLLPRFRSYQALFPTHPQLLAYLTDAYLEIVKFSYDASRVFALPQGVLMKTFQGSIKHSWKPFKSRFEECIENLRRASENVRQQAEIAHMEASKSHMIESKNFQELVLADRSLQKSADEFRRVRDLLSTYNYRKKHESVRALRCKGTCDWFLRSDRVRSWFEDTATSEPFCCFGIPGSGKTILASTVIDAVIDKRFPHVECEPRIVCYHYCDYAEHITLDATKVVASLTRQLLDLHKSNVPRIVERCRRALDTNFEVAWDDATYCFKEALKTTGRTLLVIDGIDELEAQNQDLLLNEVHRIAHASGGFLKIMLFGRRDERMIRRHLQKAPSFTISTNDNGADLARYIESQLQYYIDRGDLVLQDEAFARAIAERLIIGAEHMFLWARFQIEELCYAQSEAAILEVLDNLPQTLTATYDRIVLRISRNPRGQDLLRLALSTLFWIVCACRPLTIDELREAVAISAYDKSLQRTRIIKDKVHILEACSNLIVAEADGTLRLAHHTVQDYLLDMASWESDNTIPPFATQLHFNLGDAQVVVAEACLAYLEFSDFDVQVVKASHHKVDVSSSNFGPNLALSAGKAKRSALMPFIASLRATNNAPEQSFQLKLPRRPVQNATSLQQHFTMLDYIAKHWHWHLQKWWDTYQVRGHDRDHPVVTAIMKRGGHITFERQASFKFRPWWPGRLSKERKDEFRRELFEWAIDLDYTVFLELLEEPANGDPFWSTILRASADSVALKDEQNNQSDHMITLLRACRAGSENVVLWFARNLRESPHISFNRFDFNSLALMDLMRPISVETFSTLMEAMEVPHLMSLESVKGNLMVLMQVHDLPMIEKYVTYCRMVNKLSSLHLLTTAVEMSDASAVAYVSDTMINYSISFDSQLLSDWNTAMRICIEGRKESCLLAMHPLHEMHRYTLDSADNTVLMEHLQRILITGHGPNHHRDWLWELYRNDPDFNKILTRPRSIQEILAQEHGTKYDVEIFQLGASIPLIWETSAELPKERRKRIIAEQLAASMP